MSQMAAWVLSASPGVTAALAKLRLAVAQCVTGELALHSRLLARPVTASHHSQPFLFQVYFEWLRHCYQHEERQGKMRRTLREWEQLWRARWDINDYADLDQVFADTENW